ncbi:hypothetical protein GCM10025868_03090 [Angustibacter aerolatus]|uniref:Uncharacterized protein n=1 Tax=Angustibacter aerolatus TaxID=1162965 RepID=A0ABQ6JC90_9ACTN|nr:hypothetical protein [Angustibacter aerolatus]GMA85059.1 hypothetical protein GCM10025868_03090 [Angustibacter aerolatus]
MTALTDADAEVVRALLVEHRDETGSAVAGALLDDWTAGRARFTKVLPRDYRVVVEVREQAVAEGLDPDGNEVFARIVEASRG